MRYDKRTISRRSLLRSLVAGSAASLLAACGGATTPQVDAPAVAPTAAPAADGEPTALPLPQGDRGKLTVIHRTEYFEAPQQKFRSTVEELARERGVQLDISTANPAMFGDFNAKMQAAVQAGNPPDFAYHTLSVQQMHFLDIVEDVTDIVEELIGKYGAVVPLSAEAEAKIDGRWYSIPFRSQADAWFARRDVFEAAGIDVFSLETLDDFRDAALQVSDASKEIWGWGFTLNKSDDGHAFITNVIQNFGGRFVDQTGQKVAFNSPETVRAVEWLAETYMSEKYQPMLPPGVSSWTDTSNNETFLAGKIAYTYNAFTLYGKAKLDNNPIFPNIAVLRRPMNQDRATRFEAGGIGWISIFKGAKNPDLAREATMELLDPQHFMPMVESGGGFFLPAYKNQWTDDITAIDPNYATLKEIIFSESGYTGQSYPAAPNPAIANINALSITSQMMTFVLAGTMTPSQAVEDAHKRMVQLFDELGLPQS
jgi:multiple sugar transport system substrate-binding protein